MDRKTREQERTAAATLMRRRYPLALPLRTEPFFRSMSPNVLARIENYVYHREYEPRQIVFFPDDTCDHAYWIRKGRVKITRVSGDGRELSLRLLFPGDIFGEACLLGGSKQGVYAEAVTPTTLCLMGADDFCRVAREEPEVSLMLAQMLCRRVAEVETVLTETVFKTVRNRVASCLFRLWWRSPEDERALRVTHQDIASLVGSTRETTTAVLHGLRREGILKMASRQITVLDPVKLEHIARSNT